MSRPSEHDPITKSYAIDQIDDIEHLRAVAHRMWEAFYAAHSQAAHAIGALMLLDNGCQECYESLANDRGTEPCERWKAWQDKVSAGFGTV